MEIIIAFQGLNFNAKDRNLTLFVDYEIDCFYLYIEVQVIG